MLNDLHLRLPRTQTSLSLDENVRAKEGGKETTGETALRLPSISFPWSLAVHHQSLTFRARLYDEKNEAPEEEAAPKTFESVECESSSAILNVL